jgi:hypothetical protein
MKGHAQQGRASGGTRRDLGREPTPRDWQTRIESDGVRSPNRLAPNALTAGGDRSPSPADECCAACPLHPGRRVLRCMSFAPDMLESQRHPTSFGINKPPVAAGIGSGGLAFDIVPGRPDQSILAFRIASTHPGIMTPELGKWLVHDEGMALIREWIAAMPVTVQKNSRRQTSSPRSIWYPIS